MNSITPNLVLHYSLNTKFCYEKLCQHHFGAHVGAVFSANLELRCICRSIGAALNGISPSHSLCLFTFAVDIPLSVSSPLPSTSPSLCLFHLRRYVSSNRRVRLSSAAASRCPTAAGSLSPHSLRRLLQQRPTSPASPTLPASHSPGLDLTYIFLSLSLSTSPPTLSVSLQWPRRRPRKHITSSKQGVFLNTSLRIRSSNFKAIKGRTSQPFLFRLAL
ncbi:uncharacterized protein LOC127809637 isoform X2 [Diospyros lotus]|uniref:uncharacterized protein LOC127809637 isoform X2 n=1 Tax=Diospyros lotus TaxID=55363 RepID=UPI00225C15C9|nr:uncharacterized protein LOC127809637 isoform X2 [Diospyros lotus]